MEFTKAASLQFGTERNCFLAIPNSWTRLMSVCEDKIPVVEVNYGGGRVAYCTCSGEYIQPGAASDEIQINGLYATKLGMTEGEEVVVRPWGRATPCRHITVQPLTPDDWEILELNAAQVQAQLLNQIRAVWPGQVFPIWVNRNICLFVTTVSTEPSDNGCCVMEQLTEVVINPKMRERRRQQTPGVVTTTRPPPGRSTARGVVVAIPALLRPISLLAYIFDFLRFMLRGIDAVDGDRGAPRRRRRSRVERCSPAFARVCRVQPRPDRLHDDDDDDDGVAATTAEMERAVKPENREHHRDVVDTAAQLVAAAARGGATVDAAGQRRRHVHFADERACVHRQPTAVYVNAADVPRSAPDTFVARLSYPAGGAAVARAAPAVEGAAAAAAGCYVRVFVRRARTDPSLPADVRRRATMEGHVTVADQLRRQYGVAATTRVTLSSVAAPPRDVAAIAIHPLFDLDARVHTEERVADCFRRWAAGRSSDNYPLLVNRSCLIFMELDEGVAGEFLMLITGGDARADAKGRGDARTDSTGRGDTRADTKGHEDARADAKGRGDSRIDSTGGVGGEEDYFLVSSSVLDDEGVTLRVGERLTRDNAPACVARLPYRSTADVDPPVPAVKLSHLGGIDAIAREALTFLETALAQRPLARELCGGTARGFGGGLLLCGRRGSGKSALARAICRELCEPPHLVYVAVVDCKPLRGKRVENIKRILEKAFNEAAFRQPSLILLDDIDLIAGAPSGPENEVGGDALYNSKVAEAIRDLLTLETRERTQVALLATAKSLDAVHSSLAASRGQHMFQQQLQLSAPDACQRDDVLRSVLRGMPAVRADTPRHLDLPLLARRTEGYLPLDIEMVSQRALHAACSRPDVVRMACDGRTELLLTDEDFSVALTGFTPASLRGVNLHTPGALCWRDVGGLHDVRAVLVETLLWPSKYPRLFAQCPLRLRQGILLYGAPGTGKTHLAGIVAKECGLNFISVKGPELLSKYIGASEKAVRDVFYRAQSAKPCIVFFDEFDAIAPRRGHDSTGVTDRVVNQLLTQLDGVVALQGVYVLAATSRPDLIDPALLRPGRLDKCVECGMPDEGERRDILHALTRNMNLAGDVDIDWVAARCDGFTGADFNALLYNAQLHAIHADSLTPTERCATEVTPGGLTQKLQVSYAPNLEDGIVELDAGHREKLMVEVSQLSKINDRYDAERPVDGSTVQQAPMLVHQTHLLQAMETTRPSVSVSERRRYQQLYKSFVQSRGGSFRTVLPSGGQKVTLA